MLGSSVHTYVHDMSLVVDYVASLIVSIIPQMRGDGSGGEGSMMKPVRMTGGVLLKLI